MIQAKEFYTNGNNTAVYQFNEFCRENDIRRGQIIDTHIASYYAGADGDHVEKLMVIYDSKKKGEE